MFNIFSILILFIFFISSTSGQEFDIQDYMNLLKRNQTFANFYLPHLHNYVQFIESIQNDVNRNTTIKCDHDLNHLKIGLQKKEEFALKFYEANAKDHTGILTGSDGDLGNFDQCLSIQAITNEQEYTGKYCLISVQTALTNTIQRKEVYNQNLVGLSLEGRLSVEMNSGTVFGICIPNSCNLQSLLNSINKEIKKYDITVIGQPDRYCSSNDSEHNHEPLKWIEIISISIISISIVFCLLAFSYENRFLNFFNVKKNFEKIYSVSDDSEENEYNFIHGCKTFYVVVSSMGHACGILYIFAPFLHATIRNYSDVDPLTKGLFKRLLLGPDIAIFISGFLSIISWHTVFIQKRGNLFLYILSRFTRTIPIIISILIFDRVWPRVGSGPYYRQITDHLTKNCDRSAWKLFAFVSNQDRALDICLTPSWFISVDFQLYVAHFWTIKYLIQKPKLGLCLAFLQIILTSIYSAYNIFVNDLEPWYNSLNVYFYNAIRFEKQYFNSTIHSNSFTIGVLTGYLVINRMKFQFFESKLNRISAFGFSVFCKMIAVYLPDVIGEYSYLPKNDLPVSIAISIWSSIYRSFYMYFLICLFYFMSFLLTQMHD